ncbi:MAG: zinc ABC transporter substrate-binding protein [Gammaproteobacteria bacterium]|nr:zinc ABC transporter substrate-binding protein [Gammaproteobacteria bacterium]
MLNRHLFTAALAVLVLFLCTTASAAPKIVATIMPIHSLVAGVMQGVSEPDLIVRGVASPHHYQLRPSDAAKLQNASVVFWVGGSFETFLQKPVSILGHNARVVTLIETKEIRLLHNRRGGAWEDHDEQHGEHAGHTEHENELGHQQFDAHLWLDPENAKKIVDLIVVELSAVDPINAVTYISNGGQLKHRIEMLALTLAKRLAPVRDTPYVVSHDAYQYLERYYGLNAVGSITVSPEQRPSAQRLKALRVKIKELGARCVFSEPQFETALVKTMIEGTSAKRGILDPLGSIFRPGADAYFDMMNANVSAIVDCLSKG